MLTGHRVDLCVIGSGIAGALIANQCAQRGATVLVLEAGPEYLRRDRQAQQRKYMLGFDPWPPSRKHDVYVNASDFPYELNAYRVRAVGGSTLHWSGVAQRMMASDFETATRYGLGTDWPITYSELEPYYGRAEREMGVSGEPGREDSPRSTAFPMPAFPDGHGDSLWREVAARLGISIHGTAYAKNNAAAYDGRPPCAANATCTICPIGAQYSADWHIAKAVATGRCTVLPNTPARRIRLAAGRSGGTVFATGRDGGDVEVDAPRIVVAAHAIESTRLLLMSGIGNPDHLGRYLMEHWEMQHRARSATRDFPHRIGFPILNTFHYYDGAERSARGAIRVEFRDLVNPHDDFARRPGLWGEAMAQHDCKTFGHWRSIEVGTEHLPHPESRVTLDTEVRDPFGDPAPRFRFVLSDTDLRTQARAKSVIRELFAAGGMTPEGNSDKVYGGAHHMGTCRMSLKPVDGVVDRDCRMHGEDGLYVAGSSVFPTGGAVTPTLTIAALALRVADQIVQDARLA